MYLIGNGKLITNDPQAPFIECGAVVVDGEIITEVGSYSLLRGKYPDAELIDAQGGIIMPGLIDIHAHSRYTLLRGRAYPVFSSYEDLHIINGILRSLDRVLRPDDCIAAAYAQAMLCIRNGITTVFDHHTSQRFVTGSLASIASIYRQCGIRACIGFGASDRFGAKGLESAIRENTEFYEYCSSLNIETIKPAFGLDSPSQMSDASLYSCIKANDGRMPFHFHDSESIADVTDSIRKYAMRPMIRLARIGGLLHNSLAAGCINASISEIEALIENGCHLAASPFLAEVLGSNYNSLHSYFGIEEALPNIGICSDSLCSNMFAAVRIINLFTRIQASKSGSCQMPHASKMLLSANSGFASKVFGAKLGVLEYGAAADVIIMRPDPFAALESSEACLRTLTDCGACCEMTMINGKVLMKDGKLIFADEARHLISFAKSRKSIKASFEASPD